MLRRGSEHGPVLVLARAATAALLLTGVACEPRANRVERAAGPTLEQMADEIGAPIMRNLGRGHVANRSGEIVLVAKPYSYLTHEWDLRTLGTKTPETFTSHPNPWSYLARVPLILYGSPFVPNGERIYDVVDLTGLAPTYARLLEMKGFRADGKPLPRASAETGLPPPQLIVTIVIDGGGWNVLQQHVGSWPHMARISARGTSYLNATIGSAPSLTGAIHTNIGTGFYPKSHGIPNNPEWSPQNLRVPTLAELWDERNSNSAIVAAIAYRGEHLGMIGAGSARRGGDEDIAVLWSDQANSWFAPSEYRLPDYLRHANLKRLRSYERMLDERDQIRDGMWFGHTLGNESLDERDGLQDGEYFDRPLDEIRQPERRVGTPSFARFTGDAVVEVLRQEDFGEDEVTDLLWVEMKMPDHAGHSYNMLGPEEEDVLAEVDRQIGRIVAVLNTSIGEGNYVLAITADHGQQPLADVKGGWRINGAELRRDLTSEFGDVFESVSSQDVHLRDDKLAKVDLEAIARFIGRYTIGDNLPDNAPGAGRVPAGRLDERLFAGAFPTGYMQNLTPSKINSMGTSSYPEGILSLDPGRQ